MTDEYTPPWGEQSSNNFGDTNQFLGAGQKNIVAKARINARSKGRRGEQELLKLLQSVINEAYEAAKQDGLIDATVGMLDLPKLERNLFQWAKGGCDIIGIDWMAPEVKRVESITVGGLNGWWEQAKAQAKVRAVEMGRDVEPVLFYRPNSSLWEVRMYAHLTVNADVRIKTYADVPWIAFRAWFKMRLLQELKHIRR